MNASPLLSLPGMQVDLDRLEPCLREAVTAGDLLQGGADILVMRHPKAVQAVRGAVSQLLGGESR